jgi:hypothetical protein
MKTLVAALSASLLLAGCHKGTDAPAPGKLATLAPSQRSVSGPVVESIPAASYSYLRIQTADGDVWAAVPATQVKPGEKVTVAVQMVNDQFHSKALNRTFAQLVFGTLAEGGAAPQQTAQGSSQPLPAGHPAVPGQGGMRQGAQGGPPPGMMNLPAETVGGSTSTAPSEPIEKAKGENAHTVAELFSQRKALDGKQVSVRGKVVKYLPGIMGKNWVHLEDGTGKAVSKDNDLVVTTQDAVKPGEVVTATGTVAIDQSIGMGYDFPVIVQEAKISR